MLWQTCHLYCKNLSMIWWKLGWPSQLNWRFRYSVFSFKVSGQSLAANGEIISTMSLETTQIRRCLFDFMVQLQEKLGPNERFYNCLFAMVPWTAGWVKCWKILGGMWNGCILGHKNRCKKKFFRKNFQKFLWNIFLLFQTFYWAGIFSELSYSIDFKLLRGCSAWQGLAYPLPNLTTDTSG